MLTFAEVEHIAALARLELTEAEKERYRVQLSAILDYAARLQELDTEGIQPTLKGADATASVLPPHAALRPDETAPGLSLAQLLGNAPQSEAGQFRVPPVLDQSP
jgi:aspartyl-tRNA(Asn)/glutamyl-tRNA(Gln) amidotransferase subunit C